jgi:RNA polymerase sigma factor (sigma-70 family)
MSASSEDELALVASITAGDSDAAAAFDARFRPFLCRFLRGRVPHADEADVVQEVLITAFRQISEAKFYGISSLNTWVIGILKHKLADFWRSAERQQDSLIERGNGNHTDPDLAIEVEQLLATLPKTQRVILILHLREGWTTQEIAKAMNLPPGTVGRMMWEAKRMLQQTHRPLRKLHAGGDQ